MVWFSKQFFQRLLSRNAFVKPLSAFVDIPWHCFLIKDQPTSLTRVRAKQPLQQPWLTSQMALVSRLFQATNTQRLGPKGCAPLAYNYIDINNECRRYRSYSTGPISIHHHFLRAMQRAACRETDRRRND